LAAKILQISEFTKKNDIFCVKSHVFLAQLKKKQYLCIAFSVLRPHPYLRIHGKTATKQDAN